MIEEPVPPGNKAKENKNENWRKALFALLFLALSFVCILCSSESALRYFVERGFIRDTMRSSQKADYSQGPRISLAPLDAKIAADALKDEIDLLASPQVELAGSIIAALPQPTLQPQPTIALPTPLPTPTPTVLATSSNNPTPITLLPTTQPTLLPTPVATSPPLPTAPFPTPVATSAPLPSPLPTSPPPTSPLPTSPLPTSPPPTSPPPTSTRDDGGDGGDSPRTGNDTAVVREDESITIDVLANDSDPDGSLIPGSVKQVSGPANGSLLIDPNTGAITYIPNANYNGNDSFVYRVCDNDGNCSNATVTITVTPVYDAPIAIDDPFPVMDEDTVTDINVLANDINVDNSPLSVVSVTSPINFGTVSINPNNTVAYTPPLNFEGFDVFTYTLSDGISTDSAVVTVTVRGVNDPPVAVDDAITMVEGGSQFIGVRDNDMDPDTPIGSLTVLNISQPANGTAVIEQPGVRYTPNDNFNGDDTFTYTITDGFLSDTATVVVTVLPVNDPPDVKDDVITTTQDTPITITVLANDTDPEGPMDPNSVSVVVSPTLGSAVPIAGGQILYTPGPGLSGVDTFEYQACDVTTPTPACGTASVTVNIIDTPPAAPLNLAAAPGDSQVSLGWSANPEADVIGYRVYRDNNLITSITSTSYLDEGLINGTTYSYFVRAGDGGGHLSPNSNVVTVQPNTIATTPVNVVCTNPVTNCIGAEGSPDGNIAEIGANSNGSITFDFGAGTGIINGPSYDFVLYEKENPPGVGIQLDFMTVAVSTDGSTWYTVFNWDGNPGGVSGSNVDSYANDGEQDDEPIPLGDLYLSNTTGVAIDIGPWAPSGYAYRFIRFTHPGGPNPVEVDAVERLN
ncbi:MAG: tandem-95 repeat protein [Anaerolineaceae bacterium]|nr:tandem-95 repeat protein [Anaerolineaceae bacterium]MCB9099441.1 tandem-95 repeat protein [Anaerolineales bacterium]